MNNLLPGYYELTFETLVGMGHARVHMANGAIHGTTDRGTELTGSFKYDQARGLMQFEMCAWVAPATLTVTGLETGAVPRRVSFSGEAKPEAFGSRFSIGFAGRAIDVASRYIGPASDAGPEPRGSLWENAFSSATSPQPTAFGARS